MLHIIYTTLPDHAAAQRIARSLVKAKLVACANILPAHTAIYHYEGELCEQVETGLWCKTNQMQIAAAMQQIKSLHPYDTPCIMAWQASHTDPDYNQWANTICNRV
jgi:periplasmic divalent cation tolerance protein